MSIPSLKDIPEATVFVNGVELPPRAYQDLLDINIEDQLDGPSAFTLKFSAWNGERLDFGWADEPLLAIGGEVEIRLGYPGLPQLVLIGDIASMDLTLSASAVPSVTVRGYDALHRMMRGEKTRDFKDKTDSDTASAIARDYGLSTIKVEGSPIPHEHVLQMLTSDFDFLSNIAKDIGFELRVEGRDLLFRKRKHDQPPTLTLTAERDLLDFSASVSASGQVSEVEVKGWDPIANQEITGKAWSSTQVPMGKKVGSEAAKSAFGKATRTLTDYTVSTQPQAEQLAREQLEKIALAYSQGHGTCIGRPDLRAGMSLKLEGIGSCFSGNYYVTTATHSYSPAQGYRTSFSVQRNAT
jgi:uncharacterized protein